MSLLPWRRAKPAPVPEPVAVAPPTPEPPPEPEPIPEPPHEVLIMTAAPMVVGPGQDPVAHAKYRLDAHRRHIETHGDENVPDTRKAEFLTETYQLIAALRTHGEITPEEEIDALAFRYRRAPVNG